MINSPAAIAEADDRLGCAGCKGVGEVAVVDTAVIAANDHSDVTTRINRQCRQGRFRDRRNAVVDEQDMAILAELLLSVWQTLKVVGRVERRGEIDIEHFRYRECSA